MKYLAIVIPIAILFFLSGCDKDDPVSPDDNTITDIDGNIYNIVKIGDQFWMAENLRTTRYRNGDVILTGLSNTMWQNTTSGAYAIYPHGNVDGINSEEEMVDAYGKLYNWYAVDDNRGLCPEGWYVPNDNEWKELEMHLGMSQKEADDTGWRGTDEGGKLKSTRTSPDAHPRWRSPNTGATNESGFSGLPGGYRNYTGDFNTIGYHSAWWSPSDALARGLYYDYSSVLGGYGYKRAGLSVRCLRD